MLRLLRGNLRLVLQNTELKGYYCILIGSVLVLFVIRLPELSVGDVHTVVRQSAFQAVSIMTTTGYSTADFNAWIPAAHTLLLALMFIGRKQWLHLRGIQDRPRVAHWPPLFEEH